MIYPYKCLTCNHHWEVIKPVKDIDIAEICEVCQRIGKRYISVTHFYGASDWDKAQYCHALGTVVKSDKHRAKLARSRGLEEIGNEDPVKIQAQRERDLEQKIDQNFELAAKDAYQELSKG